MRQNRFLLAVILILGSFAFFKWFLPLIGQPPLPMTLIRMFMFFAVSGILLYLTSTEESTKSLVAPIKELFGNPAKKTIRLVVIGVLTAGTWVYAYGELKPSFEPPVELRSIHPAPPSSIQVFNGKSFDMATLDNPLRADQANYAKNVKEGGEVYYKNCFFCHGDKLDGKGHFYAGFDPLPANFQDVGTIAQLQESFLFWRIATGGPGLPKEATPWKSGMPVWEHYISEEETWKVILFMYDYTGHKPRPRAGAAEAKH